MYLFLRGMFLFVFWIINFGVQIFHTIKSVPWWLQKGEEPLSHTNTLLVAAENITFTPLYIVAFTFWLIKCKCIFPINFHNKLLQQISFFSNRHESWLVTLIDQIKQLRPENPSYFVQRDRPRTTLRFRSFVPIHAQFHSVLWNQAKIRNRVHERILFWVSPSLSLLLSSAGEHLTTQQAVGGRQQRA